MTAITIEQAQPGDEGHIIALYEEASRWLAARGVHQWAPGALTAEHVARQIALGLWWLAREGDAVLGMYRSQSDDPEMWGEQPPDALYLHKLAVRRDRAGERIGERLIDHAAEQARIAERDWLRLDCLDQMVDYYARHGFVLAGSIGHLKLMQRRCAGE